MGCVQCMRQWACYGCTNWAVVTLALLTLYLHILCGLEVLQGVLHSAHVQYGYQTYACNVVWLVGGGAHVMTCMPGAAHVALMLWLLATVDGG